jgi:hypothetical protein
MVGLLDRERTVAGPGFNRWLVPPAALAIHLCIGMAYGFSVFWLPLSRAESGGGGVKVSAFPDRAPAPSCYPENAYSAAYGPFLPVMLSGCTFAGGSCFAGRKRGLRRKIRPSRQR